MKNVAGNLAYGFPALQLLRNHARLKAEGHFQHVL